MSKIAEVLLDQKHSTKAYMEKDLAATLISSCGACTPHLQGADIQVETCLHGM